MASLHHFISWFVSFAIFSNNLKIVLKLVLFLLKALLSRTLLRLTNEVFVFALVT